MLNRSTREAGNCKSNRLIAWLFLLMVTAAFRSNADQFFLILDPYFYRSPVSIPIPGTKQTLLAYYRVVDNETLESAKQEELPEKDRSASTRETLVARASVTRNNESPNHQGFHRRDHCAPPAEF